MSFSCYCFFWFAFSTCPSLGTRRCVDAFQAPTSPPVCMRLSCTVFARALPITFTTHPLCPFSYVPAHGRHTSHFGNRFTLDKYAARECLSQLRGPAQQREHRSAQLPTYDPRFQCYCSYTTTFPCMRNALPRGLCRLFVRSYIPIEAIRVFWTSPLGSITPLFHLLDVMPHGCAHLHRHLTPLIMRRNRSESTAEKIVVYIVATYSSRGAPRTLTTWFSASEFLST